MTLERDPALGGRIQARNSDGTACAGACEARIVIVDDDEVGVIFLDRGGAELADFRLTVPEGEHVTYQLALDRRPEHCVIIVREPGTGDPDLVPVSARSWVFSPDEPGEPGEDATASNVHHWQEPFPVTVEALQDDDDTHGEQPLPPLPAQRRPRSDAAPRRGDDRERRRGGGRGPDARQRDAVVGGADGRHARGHRGLRR